ncbi:hypothetical protein C2L65_07650 [Paraburkholderia terrae]|uniref:Uncharacterized protein n=1 Tax=Paraburkholderia terrae TaxID=311230 RepID=A0A2I8EJ54_9BURK|nr:hypothetical protein C2L65_07650 [Paraburkholderia terrae]
MKPFVPTLFAVRCPRRRLKRPASVLHLRRQWTSSRHSDHRFEMAIPDQSYLNLISHPYNNVASSI